MDVFSQLSDDDLLAATAERPEAFGAFYERHVREILFFMARSCGDTERGLDLTAEVFAAALGASGRYRPGEAPAVAWLFGIARNVLARSRRDRVVEARARRRLGIARLAFSDEAWSSKHHPRAMASRSKRASKPAWKTEASCRSPEKRRAGSF